MAFSDLQGGGIGYFGQLWGLIITSDWIMKHWLAKYLMAERFRSMLGSPRKGRRSNGNTLTYSYPRAFAIPYIIQ